MEKTLKELINVLKENNALLRGIKYNTEHMSRKTVDGVYSQDVINALGSNGPLDSDQIHKITEGLYSKPTILRFMKDLSQRNDDFLYLSGSGQIKSKLCKTNGVEKTLLKVMQKGSALTREELRKALKMKTEEFEKYIDSLRYSVLYKSKECYWDGGKLHRSL